MTKELPYRQGVGIMLINELGLVFVAKRIDNTAEAWQMPQGGIDDNEEPLAAAYRELREETGVTDVTLIGQNPGWYVYDLPEELIPKIWGGRYRGQQQKWFAMRMNGPDSDIDIATEHPEFSTWKWVQAHTLPDIIVPFKRELYQKLVNDFRLFTSEA